MRMTRVLMAWAILLLAIPHSHAQLPPGNGMPQVENRLNPQEVERLQKKKLIDDALPKIRESFARGDYRSVMEEVEIAEKVQPNNPSLRFYRDWAKMKLQAGETGPPVAKFSAFTPLKNSGDSTD